MLGHPLTRAWMGWETGIDGAQTIGACIASWDIVRRVYVEKVRSKAGVVVGLNPLDPSKITKKKRNDNSPYYQWRDGNRTVDFDPEDLLIREALWYDEAPLKVALGSVDADAMQTAYIRAFFGNAGVPSGVLTSDQELGPEQAEEVRLRWRNRFSVRSGGAGDVAVLGSGTTYTRMGANLDELDSESLRRVLETRILAPFEVPPLVVYAYAGLDASTYSNIKSAFRWWFDSRLTPAFEGWRQWLLRNLLIDYESQDAIIAETVGLMWDMSGVAGLKEDQDAKEARAREAFRAGATTLNQYREVLGLDPDPAGDYYLRLLAYAPYPYGQAAATTADDLLAADAGKAAPGPAAIKRIKQASTLQGRRQFQAAVQSYLAADYQAAADYVRRQADE